jgi:ribosome-associated protein
MGGRPLLMATMPENTVTAPEAIKANPERPLIDVILESLDDAKAEAIVAVDITGKSSLADHMVVASGRSQRHVGAVADQLVNAVREAGYGKPRTEGLPFCDWVLVDAGDVIVHIFRPEVRDFYSIERCGRPISRPTPTRASLEKVATGFSTRGLPQRVFLRCA